MGFEVSPTPHTHMHKNLVFPTYSGSVHECVSVCPPVRPSVHTFASPKYEISGPTWLLTSHFSAGGLDPEALRVRPQPCKVVFLLIQYPPRFFG